MSTVHKPITPLPWRYTSTAGNPRVELGWLAAYSQSVSFKKKEDAAYIAHAANAYPRLVEALAAALNTIKALDEDWDRRGSYVQGALTLRELGEE